MQGIWELGYLNCDDASIITVNNGKIYSAYDGDVFQNFKHGKGEETYFEFNYTYIGLFHQNVR